MSMLIWKILQKKYIAIGKFSDHNTRKKSRHFWKIFRSSQKIHKRSRGIFVAHHAEKVKRLHGKFFIFFLNSQSHYIIKWKMMSMLIWKILQKNINNFVKCFFGIFFKKHNKNIITSKVVHNYNTEDLSRAYTKNIHDLHNFSMIFFFKKNIRSNITIFFQPMSRGFKKKIEKILSSAAHRKTQKNHNIHTIKTQFLHNHNQTEKSIRCLQLSAAPQNKHNVTDRPKNNIQNILKKVFTTTPKAGNIYLSKAQGALSLAERF